MNYDKLGKGIEAIAWLASRENKDSDLREQARNILDTIAFLDYKSIKMKDMQKKGKSCKSL